MQDKKSLPIGEALMKGLLIGGSVGLIASWFMNMEPGRAMFLGFIAGFLAGLTSWRLAKSRRGR